MIGGGLGSYIGKFHRRGAMLDDSAELVCGCFSRSMDRNRATDEAYHLPDTSRVSGSPPVQTICSMPARSFHVLRQATTKALSRRSRIFTVRSVMCSPTARQVVRTRPTPSRPWRTACSAFALSRPVCAAIRPEASGWTYKAAPSLFDGSPPVLKVQRDFLM